MKRKMLLTILLLLVPAFAAVVKTTGQEGLRARDAEVSAEASEQWEYLVVSGASNVNLTSAGIPSLRKETTGAFGREAFVLEQQLDKLGTKGWELVTVAGPASDPAYYFKRRK